jgi:hypothetical protein
VFSMTVAIAGLAVLVSRRTVPALGRRD